METVNWPMAIGGVAALVALAIFLHKSLRTPSQPPPLPPTTDTSSPAPVIVPYTHQGACFTWGPGRWEPTIFGSLAFFAALALLAGGVASEQLVLIQAADFIFVVLGVALFYSRLHWHASEIERAIRETRPSQPPRHVGSIQRGPGH